jgi:hypothetical protein
MDFVIEKGHYLTDSGSGSPLAFQKDFGAYHSDFGSGLRGLALGFRRGPVDGAGFLEGGFLWDLADGVGFGGRGIASPGRLSVIFFGD